MEDLEAALAGGGGGTLWSGSCSALVKLLPGNAELFVSHDTWSDYVGMLRTYKLYDLQFSTSRQSSELMLCVVCSEGGRGIGPPINCGITNMSDVLYFLNVLSSHCLTKQ